MTDQPTSAAHRGEAERLLTETKQGRLDPDVGAALAQCHATLAVAQAVTELRHQLCAVTDALGRRP